jgi:hypothetical protein
VSRGRTSIPRLCAGRLAAMVGLLRLQLEAWAKGLS